MNAVALDYFTIRQMSEQDLPQILDIEQSIYDFPWTKGIFEDCLQSEYRNWVVTDAMDRIFGYAVMTIAVGESHVLNVCVEQSKQGDGLGRLLLNHMIDDARERLAFVVLLEVRPSNQAARRLYKSMGFSQLGRRPDYYPALNGREDALILGLDI